MSEVIDPGDGEFQAANSRLNLGLKTCRSVLSNYRALLTSNDNATPSDEASEIAGSEAPVEG